MYRNHSVAVVVTAYNEEGFVGEVIEDVPEFVDRTYVIDDGSTDGTWNEIVEHAERADRQVVDKPLADGGLSLEQRIVPIRHESNRGVGAAIKTGYREAYHDGIDVVAVMNGDGQMDPAILHRIIEPVVEGRAEYAKGDRLSASDDHADMSRWRVFGNVVLTFLTKISSGYWNLSDPQNGYTAISRRAIGRLDLPAIYDRYGFLNDLLIRLNVQRARVAGVRMRALYRDETSHIKYSTFIPGVSMLLLRGFLWRLKERYLVREFHPLVFLYPLGTVGAAVGMSALLISGGTALGYGLTLVGGLLGVLFLLLGTVTVVLAMIFDMEANVELEGRSLGRDRSGSDEV